MMSNSTILLTPKIHPDLDGVSCAYAYQKLLLKQGDDAIAVIFGKPHLEAQYVIDRFNIGDIVYESEKLFDKFVLCDASDLKGMPDVIRPDDVIEVIDHRETHDAYNLFPKAKVNIELVGAAATLIAERYMKGNISIDVNSAYLLYGAIYSNSLNLKANVTTQRDIEAIHWIKSKVNISEKFISDMFRFKTQSIIENIDEPFMNDAKEFEFSGVRFGIAQLEVYGANNILKQHDKITFLLEQLKKEKQLEWAFLTIADIEAGNNIFLTSDFDAQAILHEGLQVEFNNGKATHNGLLLRKEIIPKISQLVRRS